MVVKLAVKEKFGLKTQWGVLPQDCHCHLMVGWLASYLSCALWCCGCLQRAGWLPWLWPKLNGMGRLKGEAGCCTMPQGRERCQLESPSPSPQRGHKKKCQSKWRRQTSQRECQRSPTLNLWGNQTESLVRKDCTVQDKQRREKLVKNGFANRGGQYPPNLFFHVCWCAYGLQRFSNIVPIIASICEFPHRDINQNTLFLSISEQMKSNDI